MNVEKLTLTLLLAVSCSGLLAMEKEKKKPVVVSYEDMENNTKYKDLIDLIKMERNIDLIERERYLDKSSDYRDVNLLTLDKLKFIVKGSKEKSTFDTVLTPAKLRKLEGVINENDEKPIGDQYPDLELCTYKKYPDRFKLNIQHGHYDPVERGKKIILIWPKNLREELDKLKLEIDLGDARTHIAPDYPLFLIDRWRGRYNALRTKTDFWKKPLPRFQQ